MADETVPVPAEAEQMEETAAPSTSAEQAEGDVDEEAKKLMGAGRRDMVMKDVRSAVNSFQEASSLLGTKYGETADQCADAFFCYGTSLLELARMENGVLGNALEGIPENEEEDGEEEEDSAIPSAANLDEKEREQLREQVYDAMAEQTPEKSEASKDEKTENGDVHMEEEDKPSEAEGTEEKKTNGETPAEMVDEAEKSTAVTEEMAAAAAEALTPEEKSEDSKGEETSADVTKAEEMSTEGGAESEDGEENDGTEEKETDADDVGNLQLAWEMLDLSKVIFKRQQNKEAQLKAAQAHLKLGEVSVESENYQQAIEDFLACLNIQKEHLEQHDRLLAETHYQLGLAYQYSSMHDSAISHFSQSTDVIEKRVDVLTEQLEKAAGESTEELQKEMDELKGLLPDIREKIEDSKEAQKTAEATGKALREMIGGSSSGFSQENGSPSAFPSVAPTEKSGGDGTGHVAKCVKSIEHLVRKRKPEDSPQKEAKKAKAEAVENGSPNGDAVVPTNKEVEKAKGAETHTPMETVQSTA